MTRLVPALRKLHHRVSTMSAALLLSAACTHSPAPEQAGSVSAEESAKYGGLFRLNLSHETRSIFPHDIVDASAASLMSQIYEGLLRTDPRSKELIPALASSYTVSADGLRYTFKLRQGVYFHDDKIFENGEGREMKAADVVYCFKRLCEPHPNNQLYAFMIDLLEGGREHYYATSGENSFRGVEAIDAYTVQFNLAYPSPTFLSILTHPCAWIFPRELYLYNEEISSWCIGTGPFKALVVKMNDVIIMERNDGYWRRDELGHKLPYLDAVRCNFITEEKLQLNYFREGKLDLLLQVPYSSMTVLRQEVSASQEQSNYRILSLPALKIEYYGFQHRLPPFNDLRVRKAINYAIDRQFLVDSILVGYGLPATHGFVPPAMPGYPTDSVAGFSFDPAQARALFAAAGYGSGKPFPVLTLQVNDQSPVALQVANAVQAMLHKNLGITVEIAVLPRDLHYEQIERGQVEFWRDGWIGDYADPENFLKLFYGKLVPDDSVRTSYLNTVRFKNRTFDSCFEKSLSELNYQRRIADYQCADQTIIDQAAVVPLYYEKWIWLVRDNVRNLEVSATGILDLSEVWLEKDATQPVLSSNF